MEKKILIVEDEPVAQSLYQKRLQLEGFQITLAEDGEAALKELSQGEPDLVILDLMLPRANGTDVLKYIRSEDRLKKTLVIVISNAYLTELSQKAVESGATRSLSKTDCTPAKLTEAARDLFGFASAFDLSDKPVTDDSQVEAFTAAAERALADEMTLKETREEFIHKTPAELAKIREFSLAYIKAGGTPAAREPLNNLYKQVRFFATRAGLSGWIRIALLANAFEALLFEMIQKPEKATVAVSPTIAQAVDSLERLCQNTKAESGEINLHAKILVVDDDPVCNLAMVSALKRANFEATSVEDPEKALEMMAADLYDIVLLDLNMPKMNGCELCEKLRKRPEYQTIPVIFITCNADFQNRARCILSGGNEFLPKPVSPVELVLKITMLLLQPQGAWAETSAVASVLKTTMRLLQTNEMESSAAPAKQNPAAKNGSSNGDSSASVPASPRETAAPAPPVLAGARKEGSSLSTEMIKKAWANNSSEPSKPVEPSKAPPADAGHAADKLKMVEVKSELPKVTEPPKAPPADAGKEVEKIKMAEPKIEPPKAAEPPKAPVAEDAKEADKPKVAETNSEPPKPEVKAAPADAPPVKPISLPNIIPLPPNSEPHHRKINMDTNKKPTFDEAARGVARIIFGDENISDMNVRLTRIALERYNVPGTQNLNDVARGVAQIIFGDDKLSDMNVRLTRIALERYNITEVLGSNGAHKPAENGSPVAA